MECALKACIARQVKQGDFPDKALASAVFTHDLGDLRKLAGLGENVAGKLPRPLAANWLVAKDWREVARYEFIQRRMPTACTTQ